MDEFDYIIVGGGTSGGVVAARLSEDPGISVALIEEGPGDSYPWIHIPAMVYKTATGGLLRRFDYWRAAASPSTASRTVQAKVLGGGSSINGMLHLRGTPQDYDGWAANGAPGWSYAEVLPYFKRAEGNDTFAGTVHGTDGPLKVSRARYLHPLTRAWVRACQQAGLPFNADFNSGSQVGCGFYQTATFNGRRCSVPAAYLKPIRQRRNLTVLTRTQVQRLCFEGTRATGVRVVNNGRSRELQARREVILSAGALNSPRLLLQSGVGNAERLREAGIGVVQDLPGVGENLRDHMDVYLVYRLALQHSYDHYRPWRRRVGAALRYLLFRTGPATSNVIEGGAFWWGAEATPTPVIQFAFLAGSGVEEGVESIRQGNGCTLNICLTQPRSVGSVRLDPADPEGAPVITPNFLADPYDLQQLIHGVKAGLGFMAQSVIARYLGDLHFPAGLATDDAAIADYIAHHAQGALHPVGTCRMGSDPLAVVDTQLRVHGIQGLRVIDASVMPTLPSGNTNAACVMIGERGASFIRNESPLLAHPSTPR